VTLFLLWKASAQIRIGFILAGLLLGAVLPTVLPDQTKARLGSLFGSEHGEAEESRDSREYLFFKSVEYSFQYPLFGVGPDQFPNYEGAEARSEGRHGNWHVTHCVWTQVSSECGIPALLFLIASISTAFFPLNRIYRLAREKQMEDFARASLCFLLSAVGFLVAITFLAQAYAYYIPVMVGLAVAFRNAAEKELGISLT
jgi:O-antigen ligase